MFTVYHHSDFDGIATAALFSKYLCQTNDIDFENIPFNSVDYNIKNEWAKRKLKKPCAVLDFLYHHDADWWFDHHDSSFSNETAKANPYKRSLKKYWNTSFLSCPSLLISHLYSYNRKYSIFLKKTYNDLIYWSDIIDGAKYEKPSDLFGFNNLYININKTLALNQENEYYNLIIMAFFNNNLEILLKSEIYSQVIDKAKEKEKKSIEIVKSIIQVDGRVAFFDQSNYDIPFQRYLAYYLFPELLFRVGIYKKEEMFSISVNYNNWNSKENKVNLGVLCRKLGGGGRNNVGAVLTKSHDEAISKAKTLVKWLKNSDTIQLNLDI